ncbi:hypothetical protein LZ32DRAFT_599298 [Colletotrichum eremochloae]|nr:hypothetical protein LZ32DRAFT_599298 [Colletotrichum eremochloae]
MHWRTWATDPFWGERTGGQTTWKQKRKSLAHSLYFLSILPDVFGDALPQVWPPNLGGARSGKVSSSGINRLTGAMANSVPA